MFQPVTKYLIENNEGIFLSAIENDKELSFTWFSIDALQFDHRHEAEKMMEKYNLTHGFKVVEHEFFAR